MLTVLSELWISHSLLQQDGEALPCKSLVVAGKIMAPSSLARLKKMLYDMDVRFRPTVSNQISQASDSISTERHLLWSCPAIREFSRYFILLDDCCNAPISILSQLLLLSPSYLFYTSISTCRGCKVNEQEIEASAAPRQISPTSTQAVQFSQRSWVSLWQHRRFQHSLRVLLSFSLS